MSDLEVSYFYDYQNRLIRRTEYDGLDITAEDFAYDGDQVMLRQDGDGDVTNRYLWGPIVDHPRN